MNTYIILLRGINVGGKHKVPMQEVKTLLEQSTYKNVITLLNSGNLIFNAKEQGISVLENKLSELLEPHFSFPIPVIALSARSLQQMIEENPFQKEEIHKDIRLYVSFTKEEIQNKTELQLLEDESFKIIKSTSNQIFSMVDLSKGKTTKAMEKLDKLYKKKITTRNWNTLERIYKKLETL